MNQLNLTLYSKWSICLWLCYTPKLER